MKAYFPKGFLKPEVFPFLIKNVLQPQPLKPQIKAINPLVCCCCNSSPPPLKPQIKAINPLVCCCCNSSPQPPEPQIKAVSQPPEPQIKSENAAKSLKPQIKAVPQPPMFPCAFFGGPPRKRLRGMRALAKVPPLPPFSPSNPFKTPLVPPGRLRRPKRLGELFIRGEIRGRGAARGGNSPNPLPPLAFASARVLFPFRFTPLS